MQEVKVVMPYIGKALSVNYYRVRVGSRLTTRIRPEVEIWMKTLAAKVSASCSNAKPAKLPLKVSVYGKFCDGRVPDLDNLAKVILDSVKVGTGVDDRYMRFVALGYETGYTRPVLEITIGEG